VVPVTDLTPLVHADVICGAVAASCTCALPVDHDGPHECNPSLCTGSWSGDMDMDDFEVVRLPWPVTQ
jgi:hypothetical protein